LTPNLARRAVAEAVGTGLLVLGVIGSGIAASRLSPGALGLQLLENALATAGALVAIIVAVGPVSGAHLNPAVTLADMFVGGQNAAAAGVYCVAQVAGGVAGAVLAKPHVRAPGGRAVDHHPQRGHCGSVRWWPRSACCW
jgi:glycerol uptake facilitator-like aquaporin